MHLSQKTPWPDIRSFVVGFKQIMGDPGVRKTPSPAANAVKQLSTNYFVVQINGEVDAGLLEVLLRSEFEKRNIKAD